MRESHLDVTSRNVENARDDWDRLTKEMKVEEKNVGKNMPSRFEDGSRRDVNALDDVRLTE